MEYNHQYYSSYSSDIDNNYYNNDDDDDAEIEEFKRKTEAGRKARQRAKQDIERDSK
ncbi:unnamed protein product [Trichobilharzia regenti]|nr:unnamed protein product [Trichobilharzia regenti]